MKRICKYFCEIGVIMKRLVILKKNAEDKIRYKIVRRILFNFIFKKPFHRYISMTVRRYEKNVFKDEVLKLGFQIVYKRTYAIYYQEEIAKYFFEMN